MDRSDLLALRSELDAYLEEFSSCFKRPETARHLPIYVRGQLGPLTRKSVEPMALEADVPPRTLQEFLSLHRWEADDLSRRVRQIVVRDRNDDNALGIFDETSVAKKGTETVGVQRQYCGATGKIDNCVVTVHLGYVAGAFQTIVDSDIYLPSESWAEDPERRAAAGVPDDVGYRAKWEIALDIFDRSTADGLRFRWITADAGYGRYPAFLDGLMKRDVSYVVEVQQSTHAWTLPRFHQNEESLPLHELWQRTHKTWSPFRIKDTDKGPLLWKARATRVIPSWDMSQELWAIAARNPLTDETKFFLSNASEATPLGHLLAVAFGRWGIERLFEDAKQEIGLGHFEVRKYAALQRHLALSMVSLLFLQRARFARGGPETIANVLASKDGDRDPARLRGLAAGA